MTADVMDGSHRARWVATPESTLNAGTPGFDPFTFAGGTLTNPNLSYGNSYDSQPKLRYTSPATAGAVINAYHTRSFLATRQYPAQRGGFMWKCRFGIADPGAFSAANARMFIGVINQSTPLPNALVSTFVNCIGIGHNNGGTTLRVYYGGTAAQPSINTGIAIGFSRQDFYDVCLVTAPEGPTGEAAIWCQIGVNGIPQFCQLITGGAAVLPAPASISLNDFQAMRTNHTDTSAVALDIFSVETQIWA